MSDMQSQRDNIQAARQLVESPLVTALFVELIEENLETWMNTKPQEGERREALWREQSAILALRGRLRTMANQPMPEAGDIRDSIF